MTQPTPEQVQHWHDDFARRAPLTADIFTYIAQQAFEAGVASTKPLINELEDAEYALIAILQRAGNGATVGHVLNQLEYIKQSGLVKDLLIAADLLHERWKAQSKAVSRRMAVHADNLLAGSASYDPTWAYTRKGIYDKLAEVGAKQIESCCGVPDKRCSNDTITLTTAQIETMLSSVR